VEKNSSVNIWKNRQEPIYLFAIQWRFIEFLARGSIERQKVLTSQVGQNPFDNLLPKRPGFFLLKTVFSHYVKFWSRFLLFSSNQMERIHSATPRQLMQRGD
jgi:hypothetical protein